MKRYSTPSRFTVSLFYFTLCRTKALFCVSHWSPFLLFYNHVLRFFCWSFRFHTSLNSINGFLRSIGLVFDWGKYILSWFWKRFGCLWDGFWYWYLLWTNFFFTFVIHFKFSYNDEDHYHILDFSPKNLCNKRLSASSVPLVKLWAIPSTKDIWFSPNLP